MTDNFFKNQTYSFNLMCKRRKLLNFIVILMILNTQCCNLHLKIFSKFQLKKFIFFLRCRKKYLEILQNISEYSPVHLIIKSGRLDWRNNDWKDFKLLIIFRVYQIIKWILILYSNNKI